MKLYYITDGCLEGCYRPTRETALAYAEYMLDAYADCDQPVEIYEISTPDLTPELLCNMLNGTDYASWEQGKQLSRRVWPRHVVKAANRDYNVSEGAV